MKRILVALLLLAFTAFFFRDLLLTPFEKPSMPVEEVEIPNQLDYDTTSSHEIDLVYVAADGFNSPELFPEVAWIPVDSVEMGNINLFDNLLFVITEGPDRQIYYGETYFEGNIYTSEVSDLSKEEYDVLLDKFLTHYDASKLGGLGWGHSFVKEKVELKPAQGASPNGGTFGYIKSKDGAIKVLVVSYNDMSTKQFVPEQTSLCPCTLKFTVYESLPISMGSFNFK